MRYLLFGIFFLSALSIFAEPYRGPVCEFIGINTNVGAYDDKIVERLSRVAKWMREYHSWVHYEKNDDIYAWDDTTPSGYGTWPFHTKFVEECIKNDIKLLICAQGSTEWASATGATDAPPYGSNDGSKEEHYLDKAEFIAQLVARYSGNHVDASLLETADKVTGLAYVQYFEDSNEPDYWWHEPRWPGDKYGVYLNAVHDARNLTTSDDYPLLGIKSTDPNAQHVMGGLARYDETYLNGILAAAGDRLPFDVINFHHYCTQGSGTTRGICPEDKTYGLKVAVDKWLAWRDAHAPGMRVWLTEFGWDTYKSPAGGSSYVYAGEESQANYLLRSIFLLMGYGLDKAFIFFDKDPNSESTTQYSSCGILTDKTHGLNAKPSFYYLATLQHHFGEYTFDGIDLYADGNPEVYSYRLRKTPKDSTFCYAIWCRNPQSKYDDGTTLSNYKFAKAKIDNVVIIEPIDGDEFGRETILEAEYAGTDSSFVILPHLSEKPIFVTVNHSTGVHKNPAIVNDFNLRAFPNPFNSELSIEYELDNMSTVQVSLFDVHGRRVAQTTPAIKNAGRHRHRFDFSQLQLASGVYVVHVRANDRFIKNKVCHIK